MFSKRKYNRLLALSLGVVVVCAGIYLILSNVSQNIMFFLKPSEVLDNINAHQNKQLQIGGVVVPGSYKFDNGEISFELSDCKATILIKYNGVLPKLFRDGQGIVARGTLSGRALKAKTLLTKHDEYYQPKNVEAPEMKFCDQIIRYKR